jgi:thioredoxin 1
LEKLQFYTMKKIFVALLPLAFTACHSNQNSMAKQEVTAAEISTHETAPEPTDVPMITTASYIPKLEAKKWNGIKDMTDETFKTDILSSSSITLVDFNATWCGPCRQQKPILNKLVKEYQGKINFASVDVDACPQTAQYYRISAIPTLALYQNAKASSSTVGLTEYASLKAMIDKALREAK